MQTYLSIAQIIISASLIILVLFQVKGGGLGGIFGQQSTVYRTRRGMEKILFNLTVALVCVFLVISVLSLRISL